MSKESSITVPVFVKPSLSKGRFHKMHITREHVQILSWENIYGNTSSELLKEVPCAAIEQVDFKMPRSSSYIGICYVTYLDDAQRKRKLRFSVRQPDGQHNNALTEKIAQVLEELRWKRDALPLHQSFM